MKISFVVLILLSITSTCLCQRSRTRNVEDYKAHFDKYGVDGSIVFVDRRKGCEYVYNVHYVDKPFSPASTFKIFNSLVGLETGVIPDTSFVIPWDSVRRGRYEPWHRPNSLKSAFHYSVVWYYQELARRVGEVEMKKHLQRNHYGNADTAPAVDQFWLADGGGALRISMMEQIRFLENLYDEKLKFSKRNQRLVKEIMLDASANADYHLYGKTGASNYDGKSYGWYVGWITFDNNVYFFATFIESTDPKAILTGGRKGITQAVFEEIRRISLVK